MIFVTGGIEEEARREDKASVGDSANSIGRAKGRRQSRLDSSEVANTSVSIRTVCASGSALVSRVNLKTSSSTLARTFVIEDRVPD